MGLFAFALTFGVWGIQKVDAVYLDRSRTIAPGIDLVGTIHVDESGGRYINGSNYDVVLEGAYVSNTQFSNKSLTLRSHGTGYALHYRGTISGETSLSSVSSLSAYGFSISFFEGTKIRFSKYVSGTFYFSKVNGQNCDRWGNCVWSVPIETTDLLEMDE